MYAISNTDKDTLVRVLGYFSKGKGAGTPDANMRSAAARLARKLSKAKKSNK